MLNAPISSISRYFKRGVQRVGGGGRGCDGCDTQHFFRKLVDKTEIMDEKGELSYAYSIYFSEHMGGRKVVRC